jgi:cell wall assembly regulator SMI1
MLLPCKGVADAWSEYAELLDSGDLARPAESEDETARLVWWSKAWIPFAEGPGGDLLCVDLDPGPKGHNGQVIRFWHDEPWRHQLAPSVGEFLGGYLQDLGRGQYRVGKTGSVDLV